MKDCNECSGRGGWWVERNSNADFVLGRRPKSIWQQCPNCLGGGRVDDGTTKGNNTDHESGKQKQNEVIGRLIFIAVVVWAALSWLKSR